MLDETIGHFPAEVQINASSLSGDNVTPVSEVPIGASLLLAFLLTTTHNLTLPEHNVLQARLEHSMPETTTLMSQEVDFSKYSTVLPQELATSPAMPGGSVTTERLSREGGRNAGQNQSSLMARLTASSEGGKTLLTGNTMQFSGNGRLLTEPHTISRVTPQNLDKNEGPPEPFGGSSTDSEPSDEVKGLPEPSRGSLAAQEPSDGSKDSPELLPTSLVAPEPSDEIKDSSEPSPESLTASLIALEPSDEAEGLSKPSPEPLTASLIAPIPSDESSASSEPSPEPLTAFLIALEPSDESEDSSEPSPEPITASLVALEPSDEAEGSSEPSSEPLTASLVALEPSDEAEDSSEPSPEPLTASLVALEPSDEAEGSSEPSPEPLTASLVALEPSDEAEGSSEPSPEPLTASLVALEPSDEAEGSSEPSSEPLTASLVGPEPSDEADGSSEPSSELLKASLVAQDDATLASPKHIKPADGSTGPHQAPEKGCSDSPAYQASEPPSVTPEAISVAYEILTSQETNETVNDTMVTEVVKASRGSGIEWSTFKVVMFVVQLVIMVETVIGNLMVILSVKMEKKLQTPFNYYIVNLAFTDMNVGLSVMSLFMLYNLYDYFPFNAILCHYWVWSDYTMTFESVMTLAAISLDRLWSVTWSLHYRNHNSGRKSMFIILGTWCLVAVIWLPPFLYDRFVNVYPAGDCYWDTVLNRNLVVYVGFMGYYTPLLVMLGAYAKILWVVRKRAVSIRDAGRKPSIQADPSSGGGGGGSDQKRLVAGATQVKDDKQEAKLKREMKAVYTLLNIVVIFLLCWVPFYILFVLSAWFPTLFPTWYVTFSYWMAYINSAVNPILYPLSSPEFRQAYKKVVLTIIGRS